MTDVVVVGGGLAGLTASRQLADAGLSVRLFEREQTLGGRVQTTAADGFQFDHGFQVLFTGYPAVRRELDLEELDLRPFSPGATIAWSNHRSAFVDPLKRPSAALRSLLNTDITLRDKLRLLWLRIALGRVDIDTLFEGADQSIAEYLSSVGFSERFASRFAEPFYGGITLDRALTSSAKIFEYTFRMVTNGEIVVPASGMGAIAEQLHRRAVAVGVEVETGVEVDAVDADGPSICAGGERVEADAVIVATDPKQATQLTGVTTPTGAQGSITQYVSIAGHRQLDTGRRIIINAEDTGPTTVAPLSAVAPEYARDDRTLLSATFVGRSDGAGRDMAALFARSDDALYGEVRAALGSWYPEHRFDDVELLRTDRIEYAQFAQPPGFYEQLPAVDTPEGAVFLAGEYTDWSSIQGAMKSGTEAAAATKRSLESR
jgi:phytoene dehydrogenase-like protein